MLGLIRRLLDRWRAADATGESDVPVDPQVASSRATGGRGTDHGDSAATTGTGRNETFVGRAAGEDLGYHDDTGAERRAGTADGGDSTAGSSDVHDERDDSARGE